MSTSYQIIHDRAASRRTESATLICTKNPRSDLLLTVLKALRAYVRNDIILVDDGSDLPIADHLQEHIDVLIRLDTNVGVPRAANVGLEFCISNGYRVCFRNDDDDVPLPGRYESTIRAFEENKDCVLAAGLANDITPTGDSLRHYGRPGLIKKGEKRALYPNIPTRHSTFALHLERLRGRLRYDPRYDLGQDYKLLFEAVELGDVVISDEVYVDYLTGPSTRSYKERKRQLMLRAKIFAENGDWCFPDHYMALAILAISLIIPEKFRPMAWGLFDSLRGWPKRRT